MNRFIIIALSLMTAVTLSAQEKPDAAQNGQSGIKQEVSGQYKFQISVDNQHDSIGIQKLNQRLDQLSRQSGNRNLGKTIKLALGTGVTQRTVNATSNLVSFGVNWIVSQMQKNSKNFESWSKAKQQQCTYTRDLSSEDKIDDFYYLTSTNGALDPHNIKFNGFTCRNYISVDSVNNRSKGEAGNDKLEKKPGQKNEIGHDAFYISCSLRKDSLGIAHMANHSKFMLEVDSLIFYPKYCNIPNINGRKASESFDFKQFSNMEFQIKVKITSSWVNEAVMVTNDQQLGEFTIIARISNEVLDDGVFIYNGKNKKTLSAVSISGDSFMVPRSFVGTVDTPIWGTGQYVLHMEVSESSQLNASYYKIEGIGNGEAVNFANLPGYKRWDKNVWKTEWKSMNERKSGDSFWKNAWKAVKTAYVDDNWVKELVDPIATSIYQEETKELKKLFKLDEVSSTAIGISSQEPAQKSVP
jgi:hypothetical protein